MEYKDYNYDIQHKEEKAVSELTPVNGYLLVRLLDHKAKATLDLGVILNLGTEISKDPIILGMPVYFKAGSGIPVAHEVEHLRVIHVSSIVMANEEDMLEE